MTSEQIHELTVLYIKEKDLVSKLDSPEKLAELYDETIKKFSNKFFKLNPPKKHPIQKKGVISKGVGLDD